MDLPDRRISPAEYLALEAIGADRLEYRDGRAVALALPTRNHALITGTLTVTLGIRARAAGCRFFGENATVPTPSGDRLIPDFVVTCDPRDCGDTADDRGENLVRYPWLVVEVLSPATASDDVTEKFFQYQTIPGLTHFVAIDARRRRAYRATRGADGTFPLTVVDRLVLPTLARDGLTLDEIYQDTTVPSLRDARATI
jgi:Uma2 family endonuclease